ncbi:MAG: hypothetical protein QMD85_04125 [Candidatus Aenigmarchaeota archaeon]|nr:hypothetical protein [Candidatus Aenigmarchaeota archaeon]MDI6722749.1 hypothetical protein [Candidatus Aenigmarchaeota archaeon]
MATYLDKPLDNKLSEKDLAYIDKLQAWFKETRSDFHDYMPARIDGASIDRLNLKEIALERGKEYAKGFCQGLRDSINYMIDSRGKKEQSPENEILHLTLCVNGQTSKLIDMRDGSAYAIMSRNPYNGSVSYYGPRRGLQMLGGRNEFLGIMQDFRKDGIYDGN